MSDGWGTIIGAVITGIAALAAVGVGFCQFLGQQKQQQDELILRQKTQQDELIAEQTRHQEKLIAQQAAATAQQKEANKRPFLLKQLELCFQASDAAGALASETDLKKWKEARTTFWRLYWGPLCAVEDAKVEAAMFELGKLVPKPGVEPDSLPMIDSLKHSSLVLAHVVRDFVLASWKITLPELNNLASKTNLKEADRLAMEALQPKSQAT